MPRSYLVTKAFASASENYVFLETIAAIDLKVGLKIQINEFMKVNKNQRSMSSFDLDKGHSDYNLYFSDNSRP